MLFLSPILTLLAVCALTYPVLVLWWKRKTGTWLIFATMVAWLFSMVAIPGFRGVSTHDQARLVVIATLVDAVSLITGITLWFRGRRGQSRSPSSSG
jgi:hypothetical protein